MNSRVLELLKNPKNIQSEDLNLLKEEINSFPYIQNIRALHLYGVHLYDQENYQKELSTTAAYTTDKKILYQLINGKIKEKSKPEGLENKNVKGLENGSRYFPKSKNFPIKREELPEKNERKEEVAFQLPAPLPEIKHIYVNGERNRILFEGEENFLEENNHETIDIESTLESGTLVTQKQVIAEEPTQAITAIEEEAVINEEVVIKGEDQIESLINEEESSKVEAVDVLEVSSVENTSHTLENKDEAELKEIEIAKQTEFTPEEIINEDKITSEVEKEKVSNDAELSFHGTDSFMPDVKIESQNNEELVISEISQPIVNKHEDEMRRLIEEVEKKMKASKAVVEEQKLIEPEIISHDINFAETQGFHAVETKAEDIQPEVVENTAKPLEISKEKNEEVTVTENTASEAKTEIKSGWKPMSFESHVPDSLINKSTLVAQPKEEIIKKELPKESVLPPVEETHEMTEVSKSEEPIQEVAVKNDTDPVEKEEAPVMNVSFFGSDISSLAVSDKKEEQQDHIENLLKGDTEEKPLDPADSNVPGFINTWQSWLKIDRNEKEPEKIKAEVKSKVIESFIENNPKISQLKDESSFVIKEKNDDISHLMTETLAKLYFEQKLYTKAIKAFEILANKHPERKSYFEDKIQEVKDLRGKN